MNSPAAPCSTSTAFDVVVVGAGPAGGAAALELAGHGMRVALIEKADPPRYKTCGGGVLWRAVKLLPIDIRSVVERECHVAELIHHRPALRFLCTRDTPIVSMVMRDRFDRLIIDAAIARGGVQLFANTVVSNVITTSDQVRLITATGEFHARFVVAADGVNSLIARKTQRPALRGVVPALECESTFPAAIMEPLLETARFDFGIVPAGYGWVFPKRAHLSVGVGTTSKRSACRNRSTKSVTAT